MAALGLAMVSCGTAGASGGTASTGFRYGDLTGGVLVSVSGSTLILSTAGGNVNVAFSSSTSISKTSTGSLADIAVGSCVTATGGVDSMGVITATAVTVSPTDNGSCAPGSYPGGNPGGFPGGRLNVSPRARPSGGFGFDFASVRGVVTAMDGTTVTVQATTGSSESLTVPTTARVSTTASGSTADLVAGACVAAVGPRNSSGTVDARSLLIEPADASGCFIGGGGFGGFGGGGFGGFGGGGDSGGTTTTS